MINKILKKNISPENLNSFGAIIEKGFKFSNLLVFIVLSKYIGLNNFANFSFVFNLLFFFSLIFESGLKQVFIRDYLLSSKNRDKIISNTLGTLVIISIFFFTVVALYYLFEQNHLIKNLLLILSLGYVLKPFLVYKYIIEAELNLLKFNSRYFIVFIVGLFIKLIIVLVYKAEVDTLMYLICFIISLENIFECILLKIYFSNSNFFLGEISFEIIKNMLRESWPILFSAIMIGLYARIDQIIMRFITSPTELGIYAFVVRIVEIGYTIISSLLISEYPSVIKAKDNYDDLEQTIVHIILKNLKITFIISIVLLIISIGITFTIYGNTNISFKIIVLTISLMVTNIFVVTGTILNYYLLVKELNRIRVYSTFIGVALNVMTIFILVPTYGAYGAVLASLISYAVAGLGYIYFFNQTKKLKGEIIRAFITKSF
ncbi:oligosaccharide flippase family protein [Arcicella sp. LKC2W]|uniref:oligosaccharide flippase family protein n=1 Tax=Arcicella sp. LKC2W TaxID=2984198 RepID=UPI002B1FD071|nr:oligosaccharide flippase family protein [Arcicella sp. LKC2W]MEA5458966.1 oligosaccharide flippase family protein [Arcicella sp. LKC2W]